MSYGAFAQYADVIGMEDIKKICPKELSKFLKAIKNTKEEDITGGEFNLDSFAMNANNGDDNPEKVHLAWMDLRNRFEKETGLTLCICYHSKDDGDRYDEVSDTYFEVDGMYELTPAGKKMKDIVRRKFFVNYG